MRLLCATAFAFLAITTVTSVAAQRRPVTADAYLARGKVSFAKRDFAAAIASFTKAIEMKPGWAQAYVERGIARRMDGDLEQAIQDFDEATRLDSRTTLNNGAVAQAYTNHGQILAMRFQLDEAIGDFDKAIKLFAGDAMPYYERGQVRLLLEDFAGALADYDSYITKEKFNSFGRARAYLERGFAKHLLGRTKEAEEDSKEGLKLAGKDAEILLSTLDMLKERLGVIRKLKKPEQRKIG